MTCLCQKNKHTALSLCLKLTPSVHSIEDFLWLSSISDKFSEANNRPVLWDTDKWSAVTVATAEEMKGDVDYLNWTVESGFQKEEEKALQKASLCWELWPGLPLFLASAALRPAILGKYHRYELGWAICPDWQRTHSRAKGLSLQYPNYFPPVWWCFSLKWNASPTGPVPLKHMID